MQTEVIVDDVAKKPVIGGEETILVVEDDATVRATAVDMLAGLGYQVLTAEDGESALSVLQSGALIDLLFTDVVMPGPIRSPELAKQAKQMLPDIEVLFTSGYTQNAIVHGGRLDPGVELISKPYRRDDLARKIRHLLSNKKMTSRTAKRSHAEVLSGPIVQSKCALRILVVEDNEDAKTMLCELLEILGHQVCGASSAEDALQLSNQDFDLLLTDVSLPGMSGIDLARKLVSEKPNLKVIFSSGYGSIATNDLEFKAMSLPKPFDLEKLQQVLAVSQ
jgi:CheY-like chemotaxis protein